MNLKPILHVGLLVWSIIATTWLVFVLMTTTPVPSENIFQQKAKKVQACVDAGGEWYNTPGWGENCNFDTRKSK